MGRSMQRVPEESIRGWVLAEDESTRKQAIRYLSSGCPDDPEIFPLVIQAVEKYGLSVVDALFPFSVNLRQTQGTVAWILEKLESDEILDLDILDISINDLSTPLEFADPNAIIDQKERILKTESIGEHRRGILRKKFDLLEMDEAACWLALEAYCRAEANYEEGHEDPTDIHYPNQLVEALVRYGPTDRDRLREWLCVSKDVFEQNGFDAWKCIVSARVAGEMRDASFADVLVRHILNLPGEDFLVTSCSDALVKIGGPAVVDAIAAIADEADSYFWIFATQILGRNRSDAAIEFLVERLEVEKELETRNLLASALIQQFVPGAIDFARKVVLENRKRNDWTIDSIGLKQELIEFADLLGERFEEYEVWKQEIQDKYRNYANFPVRRETTAATETFVIPSTIRNSTLEVRAGRNDPCPCGSGRKYKKCCLNKPQSVVVDESGED